MRKARLQLLVIYVTFNVSFYCPLSLPLRCLFQGRLLLILLYPTLSISLPLFLFIFMFVSIWVPEQEEPIAQQPVHIAVPRKPNLDHWGGTQRHEQRGLDL